MIAPARLAAFDVLRQVGSGAADLGGALARARERLGDERDRALAAEIAIGTLRWQGAFDEVIAAFAGRPIARLDRDVLIVLRLTIFQLLHMDRVPAAAAVNDAVEVTRRARKSSAAGLVNAVLRRVSRERSRLPLPPRPDDPARRDLALDFLAITLSHPRWLVARWLDRVGFEQAEAWAAFNNAPAGLTLRVNRLAAGREDVAARLAGYGVRTSPARFAPDGLYVDEGNPLATPLAGGAAFFVQDEASQLVAVLAGARPGERILDACASPGGKTVAMAADIEDRGLIAAMDVRGRRLGLLRATVRSAGARSVRVLQADAAAPLPFRSRFDCVLLDAPCSGLGTVRRDPDVKWRRAEADLPALAAAQLRMLHHASDVVGKGGRLVYATCSSEPEENDEVVETFLRAHADFRAADPAGLPAVVRPLLDGRGWLRTSPPRHRLEAFFGAVLVKR